MASLPNQPPALAAPVSEWKAKSLEDLERIIPNRVDLHFDPLPELDNTATLEWEFGILLWKTYEASLQYFGGGDGNFPSQTSPWLHQFPPEFYSYVEAVAHPDPYAGQWEDLLVNEAERVFLVTAIIMKALHTHVLSTLTFGADAEHEKVVNLEDSSLVEIDGFYRTKIRAETNTGFLRRTAKEPPLFWNEVDAVTVKIAAMLLPLYNLVDNTWPTRNTRFQQLYQIIHQIVSHAGWIQVYTSQCTSIIEFQWLQPGDDCRLGQVNLCHESYELSRDSAEKDDENLGRDANDRLGRIKISISPQISQHLSDEPEATGTWRSATLMRPYVVYYHGRMDWREDLVAAVGLPSFISKLRESCESPEPPKAAPTWRLWLALIAVVGFLVMIIRQGMRAYPFGQLEENQHSHLATELHRVHETQCVRLKFTSASLSSAYSGDDLEEENSASPIDRPPINLST